MKYKSSFIYIVYFLYRFGFLLAFVPLRNVILEKLPPGIAIYIYRSDICALVLLSLWALLSMSQIYLYDTSKEFLAKKGIFLVRKTVFEKNRLHILRVSQSLFLRIFKNCKVELLSSQTKSFFFLKKKDCKTLCTSNSNTAYKSNLFSSLVFSAGFSGALTGLLSLVPLLRNIASLLGETQTQAILSYADLWMATGYAAAPPFLRIVSSLILFAWFAGGLVEFFHYFGLVIINKKENLLLYHGLISRHTLFVNKKAVSAIVKRQSILLHLIGLYTLEAYISHKKEHKIPLILAGRKSDCDTLTKSLGFFTSDNTFTITKPPENALWGYTWKPLVFIFVLALAAILSDCLTPLHTEPHLVLFLILWGMVWFLFSATAHLKSALISGNNQIIIRSTKGLSFIEAVIPLSKVSSVRLTQNIFQKRKGVCHLYVYIPSNKSRYFVIRHINKQKTAQLTKA